MADAVVCVKVLPSIVLTCLFQGLLLDEPQLQTSVQKNAFYVM